VLIDKSPTIQDVIGDAREPLAKLVGGYGDVSTASVAMAGGAQRCDTDAVDVILS
jgi:hypothetical protein